MWATKEHQRQFVSNILDFIKEDVVAAIDDNKIPDNWKSLEIRQLIADKAAQCLHHFKMDDARRQAYEKVKI